MIESMRRFEDTNDPVISPDMWVIARIDGRSFSRLTRHTLKLAPFDLRLSASMLVTMQSLMDCGFRTMYGYTQSDEISILFHKKDDAFQGKIRKYNSLLASEATATFYENMKQHVNFDCRVIQLPTYNHVADYFVWRIEDAVNNALNSLCHYTMVTKEGMSPTQAGKKMTNKHNDWKNEVLFNHGINFNEVEPWKKRGIGTYWEIYEKEGYNPITKEKSVARRKRLRIANELPFSNEEYINLLYGILALTEEEDAKREL